MIVITTIRLIIQHCDNLKRTRLFIHSAPMPASVSLMQTVFKYCWAIDSLWLRKLVSLTSDVNCNCNAVPKFNYEYHDFLTVENTWFDSNPHELVSASQVKFLQLISAVNDDNYVITFLYKCRRKWWKFSLIT